MKTRGGAFATSLFPGLALMAAALLIGLTVVWFKIGAPVEADALRSDLTKCRRDKDAALGKLRDQEQATEAAKRTGASESAIKVGVHRGLKALAALFGARS